MPRALPRYDIEFARSVAFALGYTVRVEQARLGGALAGANRVTLADVEYSYELGFLRIFLSWEELLERTLLRLLCGYRRATGPEPLIAGASYFPNLTAATAAILDGQRYKLWHDPGQVIGRAQRFLDNSSYEAVLDSARGRIELFAMIRHRIVHSQIDAQQRFDGAAMALAARRYRGSRPGRFLRDWTVLAGQQTRWINVAAGELEGLATQLCN